MEKKSKKIKAVKVGKYYRVSVGELHNAFQNIKLPKEYQWIHQKGIRKNHLHLHADEIKFLSELWKKSK